MKKKPGILAILVVLLACNNAKNAPDVSNIKVKITLERFEKSLFGVDTNHLSPGLVNVHTAFPDFYGDFMQNILGVSGNPADTATLAVTKKFVSSYSSFAAELEKKFSNTTTMEEEINHDLQFVKYYFPGYKIPVFTTYIGPLDAPGVALTRNRLAIGLQQYAGNDFPGYQTSDVRQMYPDYISRRFEPRYIPANVIKIIIDDLFADKSTGKPLIEQMIEKGKQWWLLDKLTPGTPDTLKTGFTKKQEEWCRQNEGLIWNYFITNENLEAIEPDIIQNYVGEGPSTQGMPEAAPGNIGQWVGWQIVKKFAKENSDLTPSEIMNTPARKILTETKYKPK